jgi:hypothetical protein
MAMAHAYAVDFNRVVIVLATLNSMIIVLTNDIRDLASTRGLILGRIRYHPLYDMAIILINLEG